MCHNVLSPCKTTGNRNRAERSVRLEVVGAYGGYDAYMDGDPAAIVQCFAAIASSSFALPGEVSPLLQGDRRIRLIGAPVELPEARLSRSFRRLRDKPSPVLALPAPAPSEFCVSLP